MYPGNKMLTWEIFVFIFWILISQYPSQKIKEMSTITVLTDEAIVIFRHECTKLEGQFCNENGIWNQGHGNKIFFLSHHSCVALRRKISPRCPFLNCETRVLCITVFSPVYCIFCWTSKISNFKCLKTNSQLLLLSLFITVNSVWISCWPAYHAGRNSLEGLYVYLPSTAFVATPPCAFGGRVTAAAAVLCPLERSWWMRMCWQWGERSW